MQILVACEESQTVCKAFREKGHEAYSCDIEPCSGGKPEWHIQGDAIPWLNEKWDMILAFPPCTDLCVSGARYFEEKRRDGRQQRSIDFFMAFANAPCDKIAIENPVGIMSSTWRKPDQIVQPWMFGDDASKATCLWLKGLPLLVPTNIIKKERYANQTPSGQNKLGPSPDRPKLRAKTNQGIADAMAMQWG
jgi:site-specific DNA-cytosine methylase